MDASFGSHPLFEVLKCARRISAKPFIAAAATRFTGYVWWNMKGNKPLIPADRVGYLRKSQWVKVRKFVSIF